MQDLRFGRGDSIRNDPALAQWLAGRNRRDDDDRLRHRKIVGDREIDARFIAGRRNTRELRSRTTRREDGFGVHIPDPVISHAGGLQPEEEALLADSVGLALLVVLDTLSPAERLAFVLHDTFGLPFEEIAPMVGRSPAAARQLASRARRRVRGAEIPEPETSLDRQREVVDAFFQAASMFTTTSSSVFSDPGALGHGVILWLALAQWMGGMGIIVLSVAVLPLLGVGGVSAARSTSGST